MRISLSATVLALTVLASAAAAEGPATEPVYSLTPPEVSKLAATTVIYQTLHVTMQESSQAISKAFPPLYEKLKTAHIMPTGGPVVVFKDITKPNEATDIQIAIPVKEGAAAPEGCEVRVLASVPSVTSILRGPFSSYKTAYSEFFMELQTTGKAPAGELRQRSLYYEGPNSVNNIVMIEMQVAQ